MTMSFMGCERPRFEDNAKLDESSKYFEWAGLGWKSSRTESITPCVRSHESGIHPTGSFVTKVPATSSVISSTGADHLRS
jgi:hypothetical protein